MFVKNRDVSLLRFMLLIVVSFLIFINLLSTSTPIINNKAEATVYDRTTREIAVSSLSEARTTPSIKGLKINECMSGFYVTGYFTPVESDYNNNAKKMAIQVEGVGEKTFNAEFISDLKIGLVKNVGWGKTLEGWYLAYYDNAWHKSPSPLGINNKPLAANSVAIDPRVIPSDSKLIVTTLPRPYNNTIFSADDTGTYVNEKQIRIYMGEGKLAQDKIFKITRSDNNVCLVLQPASLCNCVVFRMDDVQDNWIRSAQLDLMNVFLSKKLDLALGLIMNDMGNDSYIVDKVNEGLHKGLFQLAVHGWNHIDYTTLSEQDQKNTILKALEKMKELFGVRSNIFIPPYDLFNNDTVKAMNDTAIRIVSTALWAENKFDGGKDVFVPDMKTQNNTRQAIYHLPETISFDYYLDDTSKPILNSNQNILGNVTKNISTNGYAVIVIHPEDFVKIDQRGQATDVADENRKRDLLNLIDLLLSNNIHITSFYNVVKMSPPAVSSRTTYQTMPPSIVHV